jgi:hypothetical protein
MTPKTAAAFFLSLIVLSGARAYTPPIGIPNPTTTWGALDPIDAAKPVAATYAPGWFEKTPRANSIANGDAHDCYYIDNSAAGATDTSNTYGYPGHPRLTIPAVVYSAGSYVEIHGDGLTGSYKYSATFNPRGTGTAANPIWFVGVNQPILSSTLDLGAFNFAHNAYMLFDGLYWRNGGHLDIRPRFANNTIDHICLRNCDMQGTQAAADSTGVAIGSATITAPDQITQDIVIYNCEVYNYGDKTAPGEEVGIYPKFFLTRLWILDSRIHDMAEDGCGGSDGGQRTSSYYYIGRNQIYNNLTNAIDLKQYGKGVVISENNMYGTHDVWSGTTQLSSGLGDVMPLHYSGNATGSGHWRNFPEDVSVLFNTVKDGRFGIYTSQCGKLRVIDNVFYNQHEEAVKHGTSNPYSIHLGGIKDDTWIVNNTFYDYDGGIDVGDGTPPYSKTTTYYRADVVVVGTATYVCINDNSDAGIVGISPPNTTFWKPVRLQIWGNILSNRSVSSQSDVNFTSSTYASNSVDMNRTIYYGPTFGEAIFYSIQHNLAWIKANTTLEANGLAGNPLLTSPTTDFTLQDGSPAIDASTEGTGTTGYADFLANYGLSVQVDQTASARPVGDGWDIGAYEFGGSNSSQGPSAPVGLEVLQK